MLQLVGIAVFALGMWINVKSDDMLQRAKLKAHSDKTAKSKYVIIRVFLFEYVSSPNYLGEIIEWFGYWMVCQHS
jgi:3-oxo-5-alpha-steroid 4-dehydrogenase 1